MKIVNENINDYLYGPSDEEIDKRLEGVNLSPNKLLFKSIKSGYLKGVKKAIEQGANIDSYYGDPITQAVKKGHLDIVKYLIEQGAEIVQGAIVWAAEKNYLDIMKLLVQNADDDVRFIQAWRIANSRGFKTMADYIQKERNIDL